MTGITVASTSRRKRTDGRRWARRCSSRRRCTNPLPRIRGRGERPLSLDLDYPKTQAGDPLPVLPLGDADRSGRRLAWRMVPGYVSLLIVGALVFYFGHTVERDQQVSLDR